jgi:hypothetical protein
MPESKTVSKLPSASDQAAKPLKAASPATGRALETTAINPYQQILRAMELIVASGAEHELRAPKAGREKTISRYFDSLVKLAQAAAELDAAGGHDQRANEFNEAILLAIRATFPEVLG